MPHTHLYGDTKPFTYLEGTRIPRNDHMVQHPVGSSYIAPPALTLGSHVGSREAAVLNNHLNHRLSKPVIIHGANQAAHSNSRYDYAACCPNIEFDCPPEGRGNG